MPPIKGRMMSRMGGPVPSVQRDTKEVRNVKKVTVPQKKWKTSPVKNEGNVPLNISDDEKLMQLRMPSDIVQSLPSVKKYKGGRDFVDLTDSLSVSGESSKSDVIMEDDRCSVTSGPSSSQSMNQLGSKKARGAHNKYTLKLLAEERFCSMIWDVCISPTGDIFVSCCEGIFICDEDLERKSKLDKVILPGGVDFLLDGQIVALCRQMDTVNFFTKDGVFIRSFPAGFSPMGLIVNGKDKIIISDPGEKCVHIFDATGTEVKRVATSGKGYKLQWPLYLSRVDEQSFVMSDCHAQSVHKFMNNGRFISTYKLKTYGGNEVLRPHGLCTYQEQDLFVIDTSLDSVEVFTWDDCFVQTLIPHEEGITLRPKCMRLNEETGVMVVGGRKGVVRVYQFEDIKEQQNNQINLMSTQHNQRQRSKQHKDIMQVVKQEVKSEVFDNDDVIILE